MTGLSSIDLTELSKRWNRLQIFCILALFYALDAIVRLFIDGIRFVAQPGQMGDQDWVGHVVSIFALVLAAYVARTTWTNSATFTSLALKRLRRAFLAIGIWAAIFCVVAMFVLSTPIVRAERSIFVFILINHAVILGGSIWSVYSISALLNGRLTDDLSLRSIMQMVTEHSRDAPPEARWHIRVDRPVGLIWFVVGCTLFLLGAGVYSYALDRWMNPSGTGSGAPASLLRLIDSLTLGIEIIGALCIIKGRSYFLPRAEAVLAMDKRPPILYLRSFLDEKPKYLSFDWGGLRIDRSLEMKISKYFQVFGPLVAIGSPRDKVPKLGALRLMRSDEEWQTEVTGLMVASRWLVASVGVSSWIKWELSEIVSRGHLSKTVFLLPATQRDERIKALVDSLPMEHNRALSQLPLTTPVLACVATLGNVTVLTCDSPSSNAQFVATIVGHHLVVRAEEGGLLTGDSSRVASGAK